MDLKEMTAWRTCHGQPSLRAEKHQLTSHLSQKKRVMLQDFVPGKISYPLILRWDFFGLNKYPKVFVSQIFLETRYFGIIAQHQGRIICFGFRSLLTLARPAGEFSPVETQGWVALEFPQKKKSGIFEGEIGFLGYCRYCRPKSAVIFSSWLVRIYPQLVATRTAKGPFLS